MYTHSRYRELHLAVGISSNTLSLLGKIEAWTEYHLNTSDGMQRLTAAEHVELMRIFCSRPHTLFSRPGIVYLFQKSGSSGCNIGPALWRREKLRHRSLERAPLVRQLWPSAFLVPCPAEACQPCPRIAPKLTAFNAIDML